MVYPWPGGNEYGQSNWEVECTASCSHCERIKVWDPMR
jgi:hypothetical protein